MKTQLSGFACGLLFGLGLAIAQMTNPEKVIAFLNISGAWDPSLVLVLFSAVTVNFIGFRLVRKRSQPFFGDTFHVLTRADLDGRLISGAAIFGVGWGLGGYCPGPALAALIGGSWEPVIFVLVMLVGSLASKLLDQQLLPMSS